MALNDMRRLLAVARGDEPADLVLRGGRVVNLFTGELEDVSVAVQDGVIAGLGDYRGHHEVDLAGACLAPGFIDGHLHVESSMLSPAQLARAVAPRGTAAVVADPHEIANVMGLAGVEAMLAASRDLPVTFYFMAPSCVPATPLEDSGASLGAADLARLLDQRRVLGLAEMMNFPGTVGGDPEVLAKLAAYAGRPIDGHAPLLSGPGLNAYLAAGPQSDHECSTAAEAREKLARGMWLMIRQGTSAHNLSDLLPAVNAHSERRCCLVSDDRHPDTLAGQGHLDDHLRRAVAAGLDPISALRMVTLNPAVRFGLERVGAIAPGWRADLVALADLKDFAVLKVWRGGELVAADGRCLHPAATAFPPGARDTMRVATLGMDTLQAPARGSRVRAMELVPDQLLTRELVVDTPQREGQLVADPAQDLALLFVIERHRASGQVGVGLLKGLGLRAGALAGSVSHDSHNLVAVGTDRRSILAACRQVAEMGGGLAVARDGRPLASLALPLAGLMSDAPLERVVADLAELRWAASQVCDHPEPFMPLSFVALPVIPYLKLTNRGLVDVVKFAPVDLFLEA